MAFGQQFTTPSVSDQEKVESPFIKFLPDQDLLIRILDDDVTSFWQYWIMVNIGGQKVGRSIVVGRDNPIKEFMDSIGKEDKRYQKPSHRFYVNVLDRTPKDDGTRLNKVFILGGGNALMSELTPMDGKVRSRKDFSKKLRLQEFDILLVTSGEGKERKIKAFQALDDDEEQLSTELLTLPRYDLAKMTTPLPNDALKAILDGKDYNEIMQSLGRTGAYPTYTPEPF